MPRVGDSALVYTTDPPAADIFRRNEFLGAGPWEVGASRRVKRPSWDACNGTILSIGEYSRYIFKPKCTDTTELFAVRFVESRYRAFSLLLYYNSQLFQEQNGLWSSIE